MYDQSKKNYYYYCLKKCQNIVKKSMYFLFKWHMIILNMILIDHNYIVCS